MVYSVKSGSTSHALVFHPSLSPQSLGLTTGMIVRVNASYEPLSDTITIVRLDQIQVDQIQSSKDFTDSSGVLQMTSIGVLLSFNPSCHSNSGATRSYNSAPPISLLQRFWTNNYGGSASSPARITLENFFSSCSYGKAAFKPENNFLLGPVVLPCNGSVGSKAWNGSPSSTCSSNDFYGWANFVDSYATSQGFALSSFSRRVLLLPGISSCRWSGLANVGCGGSCHAWINVS